MSTEERQLDLRSLLITFGCSKPKVTFELVDVKAELVAPRQSEVSV